MVLVGLSGKIVSHYEALGYEIPRRLDNQKRLKIPKGTKILARVVDLPVSSEARLTKVCDYCGAHVQNQLYKDIISLRESGQGLDICKSCSHVKRVERYRSQPIKKGESLAERFPEISSEWNYKLNSMTPSEVYAFSHIKAWWNCRNNFTHVCEAEISNRTNTKSNCPYCSGKKICFDNCLAVNKPNVAKEWHPELNGDISPKDVAIGSNKLFWW